MKTNLLDITQSTLIVVAVFVLGTTESLRATHQNDRTRSQAAQTEPADPPLHDLRDSESAKFHATGDSPDERDLADTGFASNKSSEAASLLEAQPAMHDWVLLAISVGIMAVLLVGTLVSGILSAQA